MEGHTVCGLGDAASWPINGLLTHFLMLYVTVVNILRIIIQRNISRYECIFKRGECIEMLEW